jgi:hypothetical protein
VWNGGAARAFLTNRRAVPPLPDRQRVVRALTVFGEDDADAPPRTLHLSACTRRTMIGMMAVPNGRCLTVLLTPAEDQIAVCRIAVSDTSGWWDVRIKIDDPTVALTHGADWHRAERLCSMLASIWAAFHTELSARR